MYDGFGSSARYDEGGPDQDITQFHIYEASSQSGLWQSWIDGAPYYKSTTNTVAFTTSPLLGNDVEGYSFNGDMAEVIVYNRPLGDAERAAVRHYLAVKYLLSGFDVDGDGLTVGQDVALGINPLNPDANGDGLVNSINIAIGIDPTNPYLMINGVQADGYTFAQKIAMGVDPFTPYTLPTSPPPDPGTQLTITLITPPDAVPLQ